MRKKCCGSCIYLPKTNSRGLGLCEWNKKPDSVYKMNKEVVSKEEGENCPCYEAKPIMRKGDDFVYEVQ